ncbi:hypothetical protein [Marisediminicola senii]|uniref:hypothetical protein n=1 Tax=Marisediminicola senii TaxID=2711233 RepID=UPI0013EAFE30|nr:hypothetical protein [Marisediminicola senii]
MSARSVLRRFAAATTVAVLAFGGALLASGPASAAPVASTVIAPPEGESAGSDAPAVGEAPVAEVPVADIPVAEEEPLQSAPPAPPAPSAAPAANPAGAVVITSPVDGAVLGSRGILITGTAPQGSIVQVTVDGTPVGSTRDAFEGNWRQIVEFELDDPDGGTIVVTGTDPAGATLTPAQITITVPPVETAPVVIAPFAGQVVQGNTVTFSGTGTPNGFVLLRYEPADEATRRAFDIAHLAGQVPSEYPILVVGSDGTWVCETFVPFGSYTVTAVHMAENADYFGPQVSPFSEERPFTVVPVAAAKPATPGTPTLAATGPVVDGGPELGAVLLVVGAALVLQARRPRSAVGSAAASTVIS